APAAAREIGKTQVTATLNHAGDYRVDVVVDPDALLTKLEVFGGTTMSSGLTRVERDRRIDALRDVFLGRVRLWFDGAPGSPAFEYLPASAFNDLAQAPSIVRLTGTVPAAAREFSFSY